MQYQVTDVNWVGAPTKKSSDPTKVIINVAVTTGVVGDTYGFTKLDGFVAECPITMTGAQMEASVNTQAAAYSAAKYPNT